MEDLQALSYPGGVHLALGHCVEPHHDVGDHVLVVLPALAVVGDLGIHHVRLAAVWATKAEKLLSQTVKFVRSCLGPSSVLILVT